MLSVWNFKVLYDVDDKWPIVEVHLLNEKKSSFEDLKRFSSAKNNENNQQRGYCYYWVTVTITPTITCLYHPKDGYLPVTAHYSVFYISYTTTIGQHTQFLIH